MEVQRHTFLTSALQGGEWSASRPGRFTPGERVLSTISTCLCIRFKAFKGNLWRLKSQNPKYYSLFYMSMKLDTSLMGRTQNYQLRRIFGPKREYREDREKFTMRSFMICTLHQILLG
jgi:hypothetical protein